MKAALSIAIVLFSACSVARADIPPGPPPQPTCSLGHAAESGGVDCVECDATADLDACYQQHGTTHFLVCDRPEGALRIEIWCDNRVDVADGTVNDSMMTRLVGGERGARAAYVSCCPCSLLTIGIVGVAIVIVIVVVVRKKKRS